MAELDDLPKTNAQIVELARYCKEKWKDDPEAHQTFVGYLIGHGFGRLRVRNVLRDVWIEASKCVELRGEELHRATMLLLPLNTRHDAMRYLNGVVADREPSDAEAAVLLEEWDALRFPNQLPAPVRERALKRHNFAIGAADG
ncbi:MAG TPA: hypothetical protein VJN18_32310 [Polyangiaceae bacterium]|nr:hypothetical protein [Polyangiaceae bacterium]